MHELSASYNYFFGIRNLIMTKQANTSTDGLINQFKGLEVVLIFRFDNFLNCQIFTQQPRSRC
jgi:hypothetical protein